MDIRIHCGDAAETVRTYPAQSFDCVVTSPPYNLGIDYGPDVKDNMSRSDYLKKFTPGWVSAVHHALGDAGHFFLNVGSAPRNPLLPFQILPVVLEQGFVLQNTFHWIKSLSFTSKKGDTVSQGHFKPINSRRYVNDCHEYVFHFTKDGNQALDRLAVGVPFQDKSNIARRGHAADKRCRGNVWVIPYDTVQDAAKDRPHPATFPVALAEQCLKIAGSPKLVLDPFVGSGNTIRAAQMCGADLAVGVDLSPVFCRDCEERFRRD